jgi:hypothetical protein
MTDYDDLFEAEFRLLIEKDEKERKSKRLNKRRTDFEAIEYRKSFDNFYVGAVNDSINFVKTNLGKIQDSPRASSYSEIDFLRYHDFLQTGIVVPHALAALIVYKTNSRGEFTDIAKICNLMAIFNALLLNPSQEPPMVLELGKMIGRLTSGLESLNIHEPFFSNPGIWLGGLLYWLIYDGEFLNLDMLIDVARGIKGCVYDYRTRIVGYWAAKSIGKDVQEYHSNTLINIKNNFYVKEPYHLRDSKY